MPPVRNQPPRSTLWPLLWLLIGLGGCHSGHDEPVAEDVSPAADTAAQPGDSEVDSEDPSILKRPFTAAEIRDAWGKGLTLKVRMSSPAGEQVQRWTVVRSDADGADIEYANLDPTGAVIGEPLVQPTTWIELRDHANFPTASAERREITRSTVLGELDGWLYEVRDDTAGTTSEFFFARSMPGAPVEMTVTRDGEVMSAMAQIERYHTES